MGAGFVLLRVRVRRQLLVGVAEDAPDNFKPNLLGGAGARLGGRLGRLLLGDFLGLWRRFLVVVATLGGGFLVAGGGLRFFFLVAFLVVVFIFFVVGSFRFLFRALFGFVVLAAHVH